MTKNEPTREHLKQEFRKLAVGLADITSAWTACKMLLEDRLPVQEHSRRDALHAAMCCAYGRAFQESRGGVLYLPGRHRPRGEFRELHELLLDLRTKAVAHSDQDTREVRLFPPGSEFAPGQGRPVTDDIAWAVRQQHLSEETLAEVLAMLEGLKSELELAARTLLGRIFEDRILPAREMLLEDA